MKYTWGGGRTGSGLHLAGPQRVGGALARAAGLLQAAAAHWDAEGGEAATLVCERDDGAEIRRPDEVANVLFGRQIVGGEKIGKMVLLL